MQEMGKRSLNPDLVFLLLEREKRKKKERKEGPRANAPGKSAGPVKGGTEVC